jgi:hypothetical protein
MVRSSFALEDILIVVKAYPNPSAKYIESSCTAGITRDHKWLRIHPLPFRMLEDDRQFAKYQWIRASIAKSDDARPESYKIDFDSIQVLNESLSTKGNWAQRRSFLEPLRRRSMEEIWEEQEADHISLSFFKPKWIEKLIIEPSDSQWTLQQTACLRRQDFFMRSIPDQLEKVPFDFKYQFWCDDPNCRGHTQKIVDWEIYQSYRI